MSQSSIGFKIRPAFTAFVVVLTACPLYSAAQTTDGVLPEVKVTAQEEGYNATHGTTGTKTDTPLNEVPQSVSVITAQQIRDQNAQNMQEVLRYTPGVRAEKYGLDNRGDWFDLRGGSEGSTLLDGLRLPLTNWYGVVRNEPYAFERIEVLRGPASVIAGQNGPGGVVNLVSKRPQTDTQREVQFQLGNNNHRQVAADLTGPLNEDKSLLYRVVALGHESDTQVNYADEERQYLAPSLTWRPNARTSFTTYFEYQKDRSRNVNAFFGKEGTLFDAPNGKIPSDTFISEPDWDDYSGERTRIGYELKLDLTDAWLLRHDLRHDRIEGRLRSMYAAWWDGFVDSSGNSDPTGTYMNRYWYATDDAARITNVDLLFEGKLNWGKVRHTLLFGADAIKNDSDQRVWTDTLATPLDVYNPVYGTFPEPAFESLPSDLTKTQILSVGLLAQDQIKFDDRWSVLVGLRRDRVTTEVDTATPPRQVDSALSKNLGVVHLADGGWSPYVSYSESFEPVVGTDRDDNPFRPKRGKQIETGVKWSPTERFSASAAVYKLEEDGRLAPDPVSPAFEAQLGVVTVKGVELEATANLSSWDLIANYTYTDARQTETTDPAYLGKRLEGIPENSAAVWGVYKFGGGLRSGLGVRYVGRVWDDVNVDSVPSHTLFDALLAYEQKQWRYALNVSNLFDEEYLEVCLGRGDCWFGTRRKIIGTLGYRW